MKSCGFNEFVALNDLLPLVAGIVGNPQVVTLHREFLPVVNAPDGVSNVIIRGESEYRAVFINDELRLLGIRRSGREGGD